MLEPLLSAMKCMELGMDDMDEGWEIEVKCRGYGWNGRYSWGWGGQIWMGVRGYGIFLIRG